jgi:hypothetical protein
MTNQNDRIAKLEAAIAELQEMVNVCEMDRNRALAQAAAAVQAERKRCLAWVDAFIKKEQDIIKHSKEHEDRARNCAAVALDSLRPLRLRIDSEDNL